MQALVDELLLYPRGKHDDLLDGFFYANKNSYRPSHAFTPASTQNDIFRVRSNKSWKIN